MYGREYYYGGLGIEYSLPVSDQSLLLEGVAGETKPVQSSLVPRLSLHSFPYCKRWTESWMGPEAQFKEDYNINFPCLATNLFLAPYLLCS